jgi:CubicO group peptidase (beta-lactamase class C family)
MSRTRGREGRTALSDQTRAFPERPNLRFLKLEAKRRHAAGEFATLHDAQLAIAREHGLSSWTVLKEQVTDPPSEPNPALGQVRWLLDRFRDADGPAWPPPGEDEFRAHFSDHFLSLVPSAELTRTLARHAPALREELVVTAEMPPGLRAEVGGLTLAAMAELDPPHRLAGLTLQRLGKRVTDPRIADPPAGRRSGPVPESVAGAAHGSWAELGLPGLALAGGTQPADGGAAAVWTVTEGWASLDPAEPLGAGHRFPVWSLTMLITATAVLRLVAEGRLALDDPASQHARTVRLADDTVTVRELLSHTGGVDSRGELFGETVPDLVAVTGAVVGCAGPRGTFSPSNGGYAVLGQIVADATGSGYPEAVTDLVLRPLGMSQSSFPDHWPGRDAVTGYQLADDGSFERAPARVATIPAVAGLWSTPADLARFGAGWAALLPAELAAEALRPYADRNPAGAQMGLGWLLHRPRDVAGLFGAGPGAAVSLLVRLSTGQASVAMANRLVQLEPVNLQFISPPG